MERKKTPSGLLMFSQIELTKLLITTLNESYGLTVLGIPGSGKTTMFKMLIDYAEKKYGIKKTPIFIKAETIVSGYENHGEKYFSIKETVNSIAYGISGERPIYIDDVGSERTLSYGRGEIISSVMKKTMDNGGKLYMSSNYKLSDFSSVYRDSNESRLWEHSIPVFLNEPDYRKIKGENILNELLSKSDL